MLLLALLTRRRGILSKPKIIRHKFSLLRDFYLAEIGSFILNIPAVFSEYTVVLIPHGFA